MLDNRRKEPINEKDYYQEEENDSDDWYSCQYQEKFEQLHNKPFLCQSTNFCTLSFQLDKFLGPHYQGSMIFVRGQNLKRALDISNTHIYWCINFPVF